MDSDLEKFMRPFKILSYREAGMTFQEIADIFGISHQRIQQIYDKHRKKLKRPYKSSLVNKRSL
jgi:DNA-directed RNA polymerase sigma subunit (sigma70/sigma32)